MSSTPNNNSFDDEVTQIQGLKNDFADIRRQIEELQKKLQNGKENVAVPVQETTVLEETTSNPFTPEKQPVIVPMLDFKQLPINNKKNVVDSRILLNSAREKFKNFKPERDSFDKNDLHLLANIVANRHDEVQDYLTLEQKNKIINFAKARLKFLKNNKTQENQSEIGFLNDALLGEYQEYKHRNDVTTFSPVSTDRSISISPLVTPRSSSRSNSPMSTGRSPESTPRPPARQVWKGGKRRSTMKRGKQNKKSQKKSKSHKKKH